MRKSGPLLLKTFLLLAPAMALCALATAADAETGTVKVKVQYLYGLHQTGSRDPSQDKACSEKFGSLKQTVTATYNINPKTLIMSATEEFQSKTYQLHPLGISGQYAFGVYQKASGNPPVYGVLFSLSLKFTNPKAQIILVLNGKTNCLLTSEKAPPAQVKMSM